MYILTVDTIKNNTPTITCIPCRPVVMYIIEPYTESLIVNAVYLYSVYCSQINIPATYTLRPVYNTDKSLIDKYMCFECTYKIWLEKGIK